MKYIDPDGKYLHKIHSFFKMNTCRLWDNEGINDTDYSIQHYGCAITAMANIFSENSLNNGEYGTKADLVTPLDLNVASNFDNNSENLNWNNAAKEYGLTAKRSEIGNTNAAQSMVNQAITSNKPCYLVVQVPVDTSNGKKLHWVNVDYTKSINGTQYLHVQATSRFDFKRDLRDANINWIKDDNGNIFVKLISVRGAVIVE